MNLMILKIAIVAAEGLLLAGILWLLAPLDKFLAHARLKIVLIGGVSILWVLFWFFVSLPPFAPLEEIFSKFENTGRWSLALMPIALGVAVTLIAQLHLRRTSAKQTWERFKKITPEITKKLFEEEDAQIEKLETQLAKAKSPMPFPILTKFFVNLPGIQLVFENYHQNQIKEFENQISNLKNRLEEKESQINQIKYNTRETQIGVKEEIKKLRERYTQQATEINQLKKQLLAKEENPSQVRAFDAHMKAKEKEEQLAGFEKATRANKIKTQNPEPRFCDACFREKGKKIILKSLRNYGSSSNELLCEECGRQYPP